MCAFSKEKKAISIEPQSQCNHTLSTGETDTLRTKLSVLREPHTIMKCEVKVQSYFHTLPVWMSTGEGLATQYTMSWLEQTLPIKLHSVNKLLRLAFYLFSLHSLLKVFLKMKMFFPLSMGWQCGPEQRPICVSSSSPGFQAASGSERHIMLVFDLEESD